jgi:AraC-like DNA-binding protein
VLHLLASVSGTTLKRWLEQTLAPGVRLDHREAGSLIEALSDQPYAGAVILLDRQLLGLWPAVRQGLVETGTPTIILAPLSAETLHLLAFERELRLVALHILGFEDSPAHLQVSLERLTTDGVLRKFVRRFGRGSPELESLILPCWRALAEIGSIESWAGLLGRRPDELADQLRQHGVRSPRRLLTWMRLLSAWPLLQSGRTAGNVALSVGYSAAPALTRSSQQFVGIPPSLARSIPLEQLIDSAAADLVA